MVVILTVLRILGIVGLVALGLVFACMIGAVIGAVVFSQVFWRLEMIYSYPIINKVNGKTHVGQRKSFKEWYEEHRKHLSESRKGKHRKPVDGERVYY